VLPALSALKLKVALVALVGLAGFELIVTTARRVDRPAVADRDATLRAVVGVTLKVCAVELRPV